MNALIIFSLFFIYFILMASESSPDILGLCETFLQKNNPNGQTSINSFNLFRKDRSDT